MLAFFDFLFGLFDTFLRHSPFFACDEKSFLWMKSFRYIFEILSLFLIVEVFDFFLQRLMFFQNLSLPGRAVKIITSSLINVNYKQPTQIRQVYSLVLRTIRILEKSQWKDSNEMKKRILLGLEFFSTCSNPFCGYNYVLELYPFPIWIPILKDFSRQNKIKRNI